MNPLNDYRLVVALADESHFGKAAERCHLSASAATRALQRLEQQLKVTLFERDNRSVVLTPQGAIFLKHARRALTEWETLQAALQGGANKLKGELSVYCSVTAVYSLLQPIVQRCRAQYPDIELRLHTGDQADAVQRVQDHRDHIAIAACPSHLPESLEFQPITMSDFVLIKPVKNDELVSPFIENNVVQDWASVPVILPERGFGRERMDSFFKARKLSPNIYAAVAGHEAVVAMVALGFGIGGVPRLVVDSSPQRDEVQVLANIETIPAVNIGLLCHKRHKQNPIVNAFWALGKPM